MVSRLPAAIAACQVAILVLALVDLATAPGAAPPVLAIALALGAATVHAIANLLVFKIALQPVEQASLSPGEALSLLLFFLSVFFLQAFVPGLTPPESYADPDF